MGMREIERERETKGEKGEKGEKRQKERGRVRKSEEERGRARKGEKEREGTRCGVPIASSPFFQRMQHVGPQSYIS